MAKKSYKWLSRLILKITKTDCPNNNHFCYYGHEINLYSGTSEYMSVSIYNEKHELSFSFDFWTEELCFIAYENYEQRDAIYNAFRCLYHGMFIGCDEPWEYEEKFYFPMIGNEEYDQVTVMKEYKELLSRKVA